MSLNFHVTDDRVWIEVEGDLRLEGFVAFKSGMDELMQKDFKHIDFDLAKTSSIDSSHLRLLININKRLGANGGNVALVNVKPSVKTILEQTNLSKMFVIFASEKEYNQYLSKGGSSEKFDYWPFAEFSIKPIRKVLLKCPICQCKKVWGHVLSPDFQKKKWMDNRFLPALDGLENEKDFDYHRIQVTVCPQCYLASIFLQDFALLKDEEEIRKSRLDQDFCKLLSRNIMKRKKVMDNVVVTGDFFSWPRTDNAVVTSFKLAKECARAIGTDNSPEIAFALAYLHILEGVYTPQASEHDVCFDGARTWFSQILKSPEIFTNQQIGEAYYFLIITTLWFEKKKEALQIFERYRQFCVSVIDPEQQEAISFYFSRAQMELEKSGKME